MAKLKNYTTEVAALKSINEIQAILVNHGARSVMINYTIDKEPESVSFIIVTSKGEVGFRLPANVPAVARILLKQMTDSTYRSWDTAYWDKKKKDLTARANKVAWRIIKDWVDAQAAIIETEMVTIEEVFLPYMEVKNGQTLYQVMQGYNFQLTEGRG